MTNQSGVTKSNDNGFWISMGVLVLMGLFIGIGFLGAFFLV